MYFPKATILALYFELFPTTMPKLRMMLYIVTAFTIASGLTTCMLDTFYCPHVPDNWSTEEGVCSVFNSLLVLQIDWAMNFSSDLFSKFLSMSDERDPCLQGQSLRSRFPYCVFSRSDAVRNMVSSSPSRSAS